MIKPSVTLSSPDFPGITLQSITAEHLELLRAWKNSYSHRFFHQEQITPSQQRDWFAAYSAHPNDWIFLIHDAGAAITAGCIGYRVIDNEVDVYNVLRAENVPSRSRAHSHAINILTNYVATTHTLPIRGRVLVGNPAARWARLHGFRTISAGHLADHAFHYLEQDPALRRPCSVTVNPVP
jgi:hypothetical protein